MAGVAGLRPPLAPTIRHEHNPSDASSQKREICHITIQGKSKHSVNVADSFIDREQRDVTAYAEADPVITTQQEPRDSSLGGGSISREFHKNMNSTAKIAAIKEKIRKIQEMKRNNSNRLSITTGTFQSKVSDSNSVDSRDNRFMKILSSPNASHQEASFKKLLN